MRKKEVEGGQGASLFVVTVMMTSLTVVSAALFALSDAASKEQKGSREDLSAMYVAEAALNEAFADVASGGEGVLGSEGEPRSMGSSSYWVDSVDLGGDMRSLVATADEVGKRSRLELVVREVNNSIFSWAAFGDEGLTMDSNARVDSYDSRLGSYEDQDVNTNDGEPYARDAGNVGSNAGIGMDSNTRVFGDAVPGVGHTTSIQGNAEVSGSTMAALEVVTLPSIDLPTIPYTGSYGLSDSETRTLSSGSYNFDELTLDSDARLTVQGPATIVTGSAMLDSNAEMRIDSSGGPVEIYVIGDFEVNSNAVMGAVSRSPADLTIQLLSDNVFDPDRNVDLDVVDLDSNARIYGTVYAPNAKIEINSNFELFGSLVARAVHLDSNAKVHFDEALLDAANLNETVLETLCWRRVPRNYVAQAEVVQ